MLHMIYYHFGSTFPVAENTSTWSGIHGLFKLHWWTFGSVFFFPHLDLECKRYWEWKCRFCIIRNKQETWKVSKSLDWHTLWMNLPHAYHEYNCDLWTKACQPPWFKFADKVFSLCKIWTFCFHSYDSSWSQFIYQRIEIRKKNLSDSIDLISLSSHAFIR